MSKSDRQEPGSHYKTHRFCWRFGDHRKAYGRQAKLTSCMEHIHQHQENQRDIIARSDGAAHPEDDNPIANGHLQKCKEKLDRCARFLTGFSQFPPKPGKDRAKRII